MGKVEKNNGEIYKAKAYRVAAENISKSDQPVTSVRAHYKFNN
jgi:DNA polymerase/3'-5' exonuclease PolX